MKDALKPYLALALTVGFFVGVLIGWASAHLPPNVRGGVVGLLLLYGAVQALLIRLERKV
jgi:uncharacterized membrane protein YfcA